LRFAALLALVALAACGGDSSPTEPTGRGPDATPGGSYPGFDIGVYPGDAALQAWKYPASPYRWIGYYLPAPCHRDVSFTGKRALISSLGWGMAVLYVGQQDWANMNVVPLGARASRSLESFATCSAALLTTQQGTTEAADAVARLRAEGFPDGTIVFLDVEGVTTISSGLLDYYRAWVGGVLADGHYKPGVYASKRNAPTFYTQPIIDPHGTQYTPPFWIASWSGFSLTNKPTDVGLSFAQLWQGIGGADQTYGGVKLNIDANVASKISPSSP
jgi:hypothetical protein